MSPRGGGEGRRLEASQCNELFCKILITRNESRGLTCSDGRRKRGGVKENIHNLSNSYALFGVMNIAKGPTPPGVGRNSRSRPFPKMKVSHSSSRIMGKVFLLFPSRSRIVANFDMEPLNIMGD